MIFLLMNLVKVIVASVYLCVQYMIKTNSKKKVGDFTMRVKSRRSCASESRLMALAD